MQRTAYDFFFFFLKDLDNILHTYFHLDVWSNLIYYLAVFRMFRKRWNVRAVQYVQKKKKKYIMIIVLHVLIAI